MQEMSAPSRIDSAAERSELVRDALSLAREAHADEMRETGSGEIPFIEHPLAVAERLAEEGFGDEVLAAGLLHDMLEYTEIEPTELRERFGDHVADVVEALTENLDIEPYEPRKEEHRVRVAASGADARAVFAADKIANVEVTREAYEVEGEEVDLDLEVSLDDKIYVWELDLEMLFNESPGVPLVDRFANAMLALWRQRKIGDPEADAQASSG